MNAVLPIRDVVVVGAGAAGLTAARSLAERGMGVVVIDKGRGVGGRMATRRMEGFHFDHGAQSVHFDDPELARKAWDWWHECMLLSCDFPLPSAGRPGEMGPLCAGGGISALPGALARGLDVSTGTRVTRLETSKSIWTLYADDGMVYKARAVMLTPPVPQALDLIRQSAIRLNDEVHARLSAVAYEPCLALLCTYPAEGPLVLSAFVRPGEGPLALVVDNFAKGVSPTPGAITLHATGAFSQTHWETTEEEVSAALLAAVSDLLAPKVVSARLHRWRYSRAVRKHPALFEQVEQPGLLLFAGDGFAGCDIEGAMQSGLAAARALTESLT
jgi:hypothetical protein